MIKNFKQKVKKIDRFGKKTQLRLHAKSSHKTYFGGCLTILLAMLLLVATYNFSQEIFLKQNPNYILIEKPDIAGINFNLSFFDVGNTKQSQTVENQNAPQLFNLAFGMKSRNTQIYFVDEGVYNVSLFSVKETKGAQGSIIRTAIPLTQCLLLDNASASAVFQPLLSLPNLYCVDEKRLREQYNNSVLFGGQSQSMIASDAYYLQIEVQFCTNASTEQQQNIQNCQSSQVIRHLMDNSEFSLFMTDTAVDISSYQSPTMSFVQELGTSLRFDPLQSSKVLDIFMQHIQIITDNGFFSSDISKNDFFQYNHRDELINTRRLSDENADSDMQINIRLDFLSQIYTRKYVKVQIVLAQIGGIIKSIFYILMFLSKPFREMFYYETLLNALYSFSTKDEKQKKKKVNVVGIYLEQKKIQKQLKDRLRKSTTLPMESQQVISSAKFDFDQSIVQQYKDQSKSKFKSRSEMCTPKARYQMLENNQVNKFLKDIKTVQKLGTIESVNEDEQTNQRMNTYKQKTHKTNTEEDEQTILRKKSQFSQFKSKSIKNKAADENEEQLDNIELEQKQNQCEQQQQQQLPSQITEDAEQKSIISTHSKAITLQTQQSKTGTQQSKTNTQKQAKLYKQKLQRVFTNQAKDMQRQYSSLDSDVQNSLELSHTSVAQEGDGIEPRSAAQLKISEDDISEMQKIVEKMFSKGKKLKFNVCDYLEHLLRKKNEMSKVFVREGMENIDRKLDIVYIFQKLKEVDKLKMLLLDKKQLMLFEFLPKPTLEDIDSENRGSTANFFDTLNSPLPMPGRKKPSHPQRLKRNWNLFFRKKTISQKAALAFRSYHKILAKESLSSLDVKIIQMMDPHAMALFDTDHFKRLDALLEDYRKNRKENIINLNELSGHENNQNQKKIQKLNLNIIEDDSEADKKNSTVSESQNQTQTQTQTTPKHFVSQKSIAIQQSDTEQEHPLSRKQTQTQRTILSQIQEEIFVDMSDSVGSFLEGKPSAMMTSHNELCDQQSRQRANSFQQAEFNVPLKQDNLQDKQELSNKNEKLKKGGLHIDIIQDDFTPESQKQIKQK